MELNKVFEIEDYDEAYKFAKENNYLIKEIDSVEGKRIFKIVQKVESAAEETLDSLRMRREIECFSVVNRGELWYKTLTVENYLELKMWYQAWLDVTKTKVLPNKPSWLN